MNFPLIEIFQPLWFLILGSALFLWTVLDGFDLGAAMLTPFFSKMEEDKILAIHTFWPVWDGNALWGLTAGGALFAIFPLAFTQILSGLYPYVMLLLVALIFRPIAFELWHHSKDKRLWGFILALASFGTILLPGAVLGNTIAGYGVNPAGWLEGGLLSILNPYALVTALLLTLLTLVHGAQWLALKLPEEARSKAVKAFKIIWIPTLVLAITWVLWSALIYGGSSKPFFWIAGSLFILGQILLRWRGNGVKPQGKLAFGISATTLGFFWVSVGILQFPNLIRAPGGVPGLTIAASAPEGTLVFLGVAAPLVLLAVSVYTIYIYKIFKGKVDIKNLPTYK